MHDDRHVHGVNVGAASPAERDLHVRGRAGDQRVLVLGEELRDEPEVLVNMAQAGGAGGLGGGRGEGRGEDRGQGRRRLEESATT